MGQALGKAFNLMQLSARFNEALLFALCLHAKQRRKVSGEPYAAHLLGVASLVLEYGGDEAEAIAALLHDAAEDQGGEAVLEVIRDHFGAKVAEIVEGCTDTMDSPKPPWRARKEAAVERLRGASDSVRLVAAADKLHNIRALMRELRRQGDKIWSHFRGGRDGTLWYYRAAAEALGPADRHPLPGELYRAVAELERLANQDHVAV